MHNIKGKGEGKFPKSRNTICKSRTENTAMANKFVSKFSNHLRNKMTSLINYYHQRGNIRDSSSDSEQRENSPSAMKRLLPSTKPFPPFRMIDLAEIKEDEEKRQQSLSTKSFDSNVKAQLYYLDKIFND